MLNGNFPIPQNFPINGAFSSRPSCIASQSYGQWKSPDPISFMGHVMRFSHLRAMREKKIYAVWVKSCKLKKIKKFFRGLLSFWGWEKCEDKMKDDDDLLLDLLTFCCCSSSRDLKVKKFLCKQKLCPLSCCIIRLRKILILHKTWSSSKVETNTLCTNCAQMFKSWMYSSLDLTSWKKRKFDVIWFWLEWKWSVWLQSGRHIRMMYELDEIGLYGVGGLMELN